MYGTLIIYIFMPDVIVNISGLVVIILEGSMA